MSAIPVAISICIITAVSRIFLKRGLQSSNVLTGMVVSLIVGWISLIALLLISGPGEKVTWEGVAFFALIGTVAPPLVRYLTYIGVDRVGASRSDPVRSLTPFFAIIFALLFLGEEVGVLIYAGTFLIFGGVLLLSRGEAAQDSQKKWHKSDLLYPLGAAVLAGGIANMRKYGSGLLDSSVLAATVAATSAIVVFGFFLLVTGKWRNLAIDRASGKYFLLSGILTGATDVLDLVALRHGKVSVVMPLLAASPLFVIVLSHFFLKGIEKITRELVIGALIIFAGVEFIILGR